MQGGARLERNQPAQAAKLLQLPWIADGIDDLEREAAEHLIKAAQRHRDVFNILMEMSWVTDSAVTADETIAIIQISWSANYSVELSKQMSQKPWVQDGITTAEAGTMFDLAWTIKEAPALAERMLNVPWIQDNSITDHEATVIDELYRVVRHAESPALAERMLNMHWIQDNVVTADETIAIIQISWSANYSVELSKQMSQKPWVQDGITATEANAMYHLAWTIKEAPALAERELNLSWIQDTITHDEASIINSIYSIARIDDASLRPNVIDAAIALLEMPFLESVSFADAPAVLSLSRIARNDLDAFLDIMAHPNVSDGITNDEAKVIAVLRSPVLYKPQSLPVLLDGLDGTQGVYLEDKVIQLPLTGETLLTIIRLRDQTTASMDHLEHSVRFAEKFMGEPLPTSYFAIYYDDATIDNVGGQALGTHMTITPFGDGLDRFAKVIAHELAHYYWTGTSMIWIKEGPSELIAFVSERKRAGTPLGTHLIKGCTAVKTLAELELINPKGKEYGHQCTYYLGGSLFLDLHNILGEEAFRPAFRNLYLKRLHDDPTDDCEGTDLNICHLEAAFKDGASPEVVRKVDEVINRWYYGK